MVYTLGTNLGGIAVSRMYEGLLALRTVRYWFLFRYGCGVSALWCAMAIGMAAGAQEVPPNLLVNPSFEEATPETGLPAAWSLYSAQDEQRRLTLIDDTTDGAKALQLEDDSPGEELGLSQTVAAEPGIAYIASVRVKAMGEASPAGSFIQLRFLPSGEYVQRPLVPGLAGEAAEVRAGMVAPPGTTEAVVYLYSHRGPTPKVILDAAQLVTVAELPPELLLPNTPKAPEIAALKPLYLETSLVEAGAAIPIVVPADGSHDADAAVIANAIEAAGGARPAVLKDDAFATGLVIHQSLIALGNRSTNQLLEALYERHYSLTDLRYPGAGGHEVRTLHNPLGNGNNVIIVGGSDAAGVTNSALLFSQKVSEIAKTDTGLRIGRLMEIQLGAGITPPLDLAQFETWDASAGYGSIGYFGWNSISKRMAMYYMTGDPFHAREAIRLAFPNEQAKAEIALQDGERIENKDAPLSGPYHYNAHLMILYWDLIEESPVFSDEERLQVTRALAKQLEHPGIASAYLGPYAGVPSAVGSRHGQWSAIALYCLGRYFAKDYDDPIWPVCEDNGEMHFRSLHTHAWVQGESDNLFWYVTGIAPVLQYMMLTGDRVPQQNGVLTTLLRGVDVLASGRDGDARLKYGAISFFHQAAQLTGDGRWLEYLRRTGINRDAFRVGQSWWPAPGLAPAQPSGLNDTWQLLALPAPQWLSRNSGLPPEESFQLMSYRSAPDATGDYLLLDGLNGASRNPYHSFAILELRQDGQTILDGYNNQIRTRADGLTEPSVSMDAALKEHRMLGEIITAVAEVTHAGYAGWRRSILNRRGRYTIVVDTLTPHTDSNNFEIQLSWETTQGDWSAGAGASRVTLPNSVDPARTPAIQTSRAMHLQQAGNIATLTWTGPATKDQPQYLFSAIGRGAPEGEGSIVCAPLGANAAAMRLPQPAVAATGAYDGLEGGLVLVAPDYVYGLDLIAARELIRCDAPIEFSWDFTAGLMEVVTTKPTTLILALDGPEKLRLDRTPVTGEMADGKLRITLDAGRHRITGATLTQGRIDVNTAWLNDTLAAAFAAAPPAPTSAETAPGAILPEQAAYTCSGPVTNLVLLPSEAGSLIAASAGNTIHVFAPDGTPVRTMDTDGPIRVLRFWPEHRLLLAGCTDEKVIAFDDSGARRWEFTSEMDPAVFLAAKTYWFKSAPGHEGIHGLHTGTFLDGKSQAFVGSACTLEILDENGQLLKRLPQFWGTVATMALLPQDDASISLLAARRYNDYNNLAVISNTSLNPNARGFDGVPEGHTAIGGWSAMNREHILLQDFDGDGATDVLSETNGTWNRVTVWDANGKPKYSASLGPGEKIPARNIRGLATADLDDDGLPEIIVADKSGLLIALEGTCERKWSTHLGTSAIVLTTSSSTSGGPPLIIIGDENSAVKSIDASGTVTAQGKIDGLPTTILDLGEGTIAIGTQNGSIGIFGG